MAEQSVKLGTVGGGLIPRSKYFWWQAQLRGDVDDFTLCQGGGDPDSVQLVLQELHDYTSLQLKIK